MQNMNSGGNFVPWCSTRTRAWVTRRFLGVYPGATRSPSHPSSVSRFFLIKTRIIYRNWNIYLTFTDKPPGEQKMNLSFTFSIREISEVKDSDQVGTVYYIFCAKYISYSVQNILYILYFLSIIYYIFWAEYIIYSRWRFTSIKKWWSNSSKVLKIPMYFTVAWEENRLMVDEGHRLKKNRKDKDS